MEGVKTIEAARIRAQGIKLQPTAALPAADANRCADLLYALADELEAARKEIAELSTHCEMLKNTGAQLEANICDRYESRRRELKDALAAERARAEKAEQSLKISEEVEIHATAQRHQTLDLLEERIARLTERAEKAERERDEVRELFEAQRRAAERFAVSAHASSESETAMLARLADLERWREQAGLIPLSVRMPAFDEGLRVLVYTEGVDFNGAQFFDVRADDLYQPVSEVEAHATHWMPRPLPESPKVTK